MVEQKLRVNFVVPPFDADRFTGGILCIMEHAHQLTQRGHQVTMVTSQPSPRPRWFTKTYGNLLSPETPSAATSAVQIGLNLGRWALSRNQDIKFRIREEAANLLAAARPFWTSELEAAIHLRALRHIMPDADVTIATHYSTAWPVSMFGAGARAYFMQHYEVYFAEDTPDSAFNRASADMSYRSGLEMIANSPWLREMIRTHSPDATVRLCPNAIDHTIFNGQPKAPSEKRTFRVISYGGRGVAWKGFQEMAEAIAIARHALPTCDIEWCVYGSAGLPPNNSIAPYIALGFLHPQELAAAYRAADALLSASWYESFPLFPAEAMACGLPVVTTQPGTEQYAKAGITAEIVEPRSPQSIANGLVKLIQNPQYRTQIASAGHAAAAKLTWAAAGREMERNLLEIVQKRHRGRQGCSIHV